MSITLSEPVDLLTPFGLFTTHVGLFGDGPSVLLCAHRIRDSVEPPLVRVQYGCAHGTVLRSLSCDCGSQIENALHMFSQSTRSTLFLYFRDHEAYGLGVFEKMALLAEEQRTGLSYSELAAQGRFRRPDDGVVWVLPFLLDRLGFARRIGLLTASHTKRAAIEQTGVEVVERVAIGGSDVPADRETHRP